MKEVETALAAHPFLAGLERKLVKKLAPHASAERFRAGQLVLKEGQAADASYLLQTGRVALEIHAPGRGPLAIGTASAGEVVGWSWIAQQRRWHFDARAVEATQVLKLEGAALARLCDEDRDLGYELLKRFLVVVQARLEGVRLQLLDVYGRGEVELPWV